MKLKTEMVAPDSTSANWYPASRDDGQSYLHDAAAAHALLHAIAVWGKHPGYQGGESWVIKRADELMREWGFES